MDISHGVSKSGWCIRLLIRVISSSSSMWDPGVVDIFIGRGMTAGEGRHRRYRSVVVGVSMLSPMVVRLTRSLMLLAPSVVGSASSCTVGRVIP